ncbi:MAG: sugar phosphate nucleotidyltransferase [Candidatus Bipolaricaulia bacterium]
MKDPQTAWDESDQQPGAHAVRDLTVIVMVGGEGVRLYPLTIDKPKALLPVCNHPLLNLLVGELIDQGCCRFIFAFANQGDSGKMSRIRIAETLVGGQELSGLLSDPSLDFHMSPLYHNVGIADVIHLCVEYYQIEQEILVVMGDHVVYLPVRELLEAHRRREALLTVALWEAEGVQKNGIVRLTEDGRIQTFIKKSSTQNGPSRLVNTGVYLLSPEVCRYFDHPTDRDWIINGDLDMSYRMIPFLIEETDRVYGWNLSQRGIPYWSDVGTPHQYRQTAWDILHGRLQHFQLEPAVRPGIYMSPTSRRRNASELEAGRIDFRGISLVGKDVEIGEDVVIENAIIGDTCVIEDGCRIVDTTIMGQTHLEPGILARGTIIGESCEIRAGSQLLEGSVIGNGSRILADSLIDRDELIAPRDSVHTVLKTGKYTVAGADEANIYFYRRERSETQRMK